MRRYKYNTEQGTRAHCPRRFRDIEVTDPKNERRLVMIKEKMVLGMLICLSVIAIVVPSNAQMRRRNPTEERSSQGLPPGFDPKEIDRRMQAEAAERRQRYAAEREQRRTQMMQNIRQSNKQADSRRDESIKRAIGATDQQWQVIFPKFDKVRTLMRQARYGLATVGYTSSVSSGGRREAGSSSSRRNRSSSGTGDGVATAGAGANAGNLGGSDWKPLDVTENKDTNTRTQSGWKWARPSENKGRNELTAVEKAAEDLLDCLEKPKSREADIREKLTALRRIREQATKELPKAQQEFRGILTFDQEAKFVLMGYLE